MHKLLEYVCDEMEELESKADKGKLSMAEMQYLDTLAHTKKNLLKADEMMGEGYSEDGSYRGSYDRGGNSYDGSYRGDRTYNSSYGSMARGRGRNAKRDSMGRYSRDMADELRQMMEDAPDDRTRQEFQRFIQKIEQM